MRIPRSIVINRWGDLTQCRGSISPIFHPDNHMFEVAFELKLTTAQQVHQYKLLLDECFLIIDEAIIEFTKEPAREASGILRNEWQRLFRRRILDESRVSRDTFAAWDNDFRNSGLQWTLALENYYVQAKYQANVAYQESFHSAESAFYVIRDHLQSLGYHIVTEQQYAEILLPSQVYLSEEFQKNHRYYDQVKVQVTNDLKRVGALHDAERAHRELDRARPFLRAGASPSRSYERFAAEVRD